MALKPTSLTYCLVQLLRRRRRRGHPLPRHPVGLSARTGPQLSLPTAPGSLHSCLWAGKFRWAFLASGTLVLRSLGSVCVWELCSVIVLNPSSIARRSLALRPFSYTHARAPSPDSVGRPLLALHKECLASFDAAIRPSMIWKKTCLRQSTQPGNCPVLNTLIFQPPPGALKDSGAHPDRVSITRALSRENISPSSPAPLDARGSSFSYLASEDPLSFGSSCSRRSIRHLGPDPHPIPKSTGIQDRPDHYHELPYGSDLRSWRRGFLLYARADSANSQPVFW